MKPHVLSIMVTVIVFQSACSVYLAATQPGPAPISDLGVTSPRAQVLTALGPPKFSDTDPQGRKEEIFEFKSGLHQASKARIVLYLAGDVFTLGLAELIFWPMELTVMDSATCIATVTYDQSQKVETWNLAKKGGVQGC